MMQVPGTEYTPRGFADTMREQIVGVVVHELVHETAETT